MYKIENNMLISNILYKLSNKVNLTSKSSLYDFTQIISGKFQTYKPLDY